MDMPDSNTRFYPAGGEQPAPARGRGRLHGLRIMIVDDVQDARDMIAEMLSLHGAEVVAVESVREALAQIRMNAPDALITDISMPDEDGYALIRSLRALKPEEGGNIPAAALTAHASEAVRSRLLTAGFQMHLAKPIDLMELPSQLLGLIKGTPIPG